MKTIQDEVMDRALELLGEHFENGVILADAQDLEHPNEDGKILFNRRNASTWTVLGMMKVYERMLLDFFQETGKRD